MTCNPNEKHTGLSSWEKHCQEAVKTFLMNAVVIDNNPRLGETTVSENKPPKIAKIKDDGFGSETKEATNEVESDKKTEDVEHEKTEEDPGSELNIRRLSDAFADKQINCSCVFPYDGDPERKQKVERIISAALPSDIVIIDWYLQEKDSSITTDILERIAKTDAQTNGRIRVICIYTWEPQIDMVLEKAEEALKKGKLPVETFQKGDGVLQGDNFYLTVVKKNKSEKDLPDHLISCAAKLSKGMLPSFAVAAVSAIRKNMHHIITKFPKELDAAYVANRLITDPPQDVAELIKDLFISECNTALEIEKVVENYIDIDQIQKWVNDKGQPINAECKPIYEGGKAYPINREKLDGLMQNGIDEISSEAKRQYVSHCLHNSTKESIEAQKQFSRFVVMKHELFGNSKIQLDSNWQPILSLGSIIYRIVKDKVEYYYCLTPACDTLRLTGKITNFLFLKLEDPPFKSEKKPKSHEKKINLVLTDNERKLKSLYMNLHPSNIIPFCFKGDEECGRVKGERIDSNGNPSFIFKTYKEDDETNQDVFYWIGEIRKHRANSDMAELNKQWLRFGINDSEYLRLAINGNSAFEYLGNDEN